MLQAFHSEWDTHFPKHGRVRAGGKSTKESGMEGKKKNKLSGPSGGA